MHETNNQSTNLSPTEAKRKGVDQATESIHALGKQVSLFKYLSSVEREMIYSLCKKRQYQNGESIPQEGIPGSGLYIIDKGQVTVTKQGKQVKIFSWQLLRKVVILEKCRS